ncbi:MAG: hypothetical protein QOD85_1126 [Gaiellaceae bacterium]|jgi:hypothetical protein|nr:hypothetical protein [Gaiellaceae bacterium]
MRRALPALAALAVALLLPAAAAAKGPSTATIAGPGLDHALEINREGGDASQLGILVEGGGLFAQVYQPTPRLTTKTRPAGQLGPRYDVTYIVPGPNGDSTLRQDLYPYADTGPLTYMTPAQRFWGSQSTNGGWFRGSSQLKQMLVRAGLPSAAPVAHAGHPRGVGIALETGAGIAVAAAALALVYRRRRSASA